MPTKPIDRLLFAQGGECFFCKQVLQKSDASLEHLVAQTHGGKDNDENVVVCCKILNALFGRMSLKEKLEVILKQRGAFGCPAQARAAIAAAATPSQGEVPLKAGSPLAVVVENLKKRGNARQTRLDKLANTIKTALEHQKLDGSQADKVLAQLRSKQWVQVDGEKVSYHLPVEKVDAGIHLS
ncbi:MAG: hypothetical protein Q8S02_07580 [Hydrogenophaga sp.]|nr:hypothetical protein [Hydrogenophaga sp.]